MHRAGTVVRSAPSPSSPPWQTIRSIRTQTEIPQDSFTLAAHEALALIAGSSLAQFFDCIPATVWMTDTDLKLTFAQGPILRDLDVAPEKVLGRTLQEIVLDGREDHPLIHGHLTALSGHATSVRIEWGGILYNARIAPLRDASGTIIGCVGSHQQIGWLPDDDGCFARATCGCAASSTPT